MRMKMKKEIKMKMNTEYFDELAKCKMIDEKFDKLPNLSKFKIYGELFVKFNGMKFPYESYKMMIRHLKEDKESYLFSEEHRRNFHKVIGIEEDGTIIIEE